MPVFNFKKLTVFSAFLLLCTFSLLSFASAESVQPKFQKAVQSKNCETVIKLFPELVAENDIYYGTLSNFYEKGICLPQDYTKAFETFLKTPDDSSGLKEIKLGQFYANGWGTPENKEKAKELFELGVKKEILRSEEISDVRFGLNLLLGTKNLPSQLKEILTYYENLKWDADQKYNFAMKFIENEKSEESKLTAFTFLIRLTNQNNHLQSAYEVASWYLKNNDIKNANVYFLNAALKGHPKAQAHIGRAYFFDKSQVVGKRTAYELLYRAFLADKVTAEEIAKAEQSLNKWEIKSGREEAAQPLPQSNSQN
ncbi:hypothetical protein RYZ26_19745 [Terasakiella sp. A23]|uniref:tetratricopeptide repeat protein n=1 Tax=Terasakiella sp. FCG-A23 TaxID=3080561 RepID=UPI002953E0E6|nr:hypothetical protein [Terasakiella sp. A23]MDV7341839.1 hypothetical protein [Terasakiella sp. A23]